MPWVDFRVTLWEKAKPSIFRWKTIIYIALQKFFLGVSLLPYNTCAASEAEEKGAMGWG